MAAASLVTSIFGNSPAFPIDWPGLRGLQGVVPQGPAEHEVPGNHLPGRDGNRWRIGALYSPRRGQMAPPIGITTDHMHATCPVSSHQHPPPPRPPLPTPLT